LKRKLSKVDEYHHLRIKFLKEEHEAKISLIQMEREVLQEKREQNLKENEATLKNLDLLHEKYSHIA